MSLRRRGYRWICNGWRLCKELCASVVLCTTFAMITGTLSSSSSLSNCQKLSRLIRFQRLSDEAYRRPCSQWETSTMNWARSAQSSMTPRKALFLTDAGFSFQVRFPGYFRVGVPIRCETPSTPWNNLSLKFHGVRHQFRAFVLAVSCFSAGKQGVSRWGS